MVSSLKWNNIQLSLHHLAGQNVVNRHDGKLKQSMLPSRCNTRSCFDEIIVYEWHMS